MRTPLPNRHDPNPRQRQGGALGSAGGAGQGEHPMTDDQGLPSSWDQMSPVSGRARTDVPDADPSQPLSSNLRGHDSGPSDNDRNDHWDRRPNTKSMEHQNKILAAAESVAYMIAALSHESLKRGPDLVQRRIDFSGPVHSSPFKLEIVPDQSLKRFAWEIHAERIMVPPVLVALDAPTLMATNCLATSRIMTMTTTKYDNAVLQAVKPGMRGITTSKGPSISMIDGSTII